MILQAVNNYVTIEPIQRSTSDLTSNLGSSISERWGRVKSIGPGVPDINGKLIPCDVQPGQLVYTMAHGRHQVDLSVFGSENTFMCSILDVLCYVEDEETMKLKPLGNYVMVDKAEPIKETAGGVLLPDSVLPPPNTGKVIELGTGWTTISGERVPFQVEVGQTIAFEPFKTMVVDLTDLNQDGKVYLVQHGSIMGVLVD